MELAAVQGLELRPELLVFQLHLLALAPFPIQLLVESGQLIFVVAFDAGDLLAAPPNPAGGQTFQIGASLPIRAAELLWQVGEAGHGQSEGGSWSRRQLTSERRPRSLRALR